VKYSKGAELKIITSVHNKVGAEEVRRET